jgi:hypothetical protein
LAGASSKRRRNKKRRESPIVFCAWCGRVRILGSWVGVPAEAVARERERFGISDGICPDCFARVSP